MAERRRLSDILRGNDLQRLEQVFGSTAAAAELTPIPAGVYRCRITDGTAFEAKTGMPGYKLTMEVEAGDYQGRTLWFDIWLSEASLPIAKRELLKIGVTSLKKLDNPVPGGIIVEAKVAVRKNDNGEEFNRVVKFDVIEFKTPEADPFAPVPSHLLQDTCDDDGFDWASGEQHRKDGATR